MLGCVYAHLELKVGLRDLDKSFHISYLYIENFWVISDSSGFHLINLIKVYIIQWLYYMTIYRIHPKSKYVLDMNILKYNKTKSSVY